MSAYYNEIDADAVLILRALIADGVIAPGEIDTRSIIEVQPDDLIGFTQCHFFAGGGLWSVAARMAGWPDERPLWTASCPCQPFSVAGKGGGTDDVRHLWPDILRLAGARRPPVLVGEQVAGKAGYGWFDGVRADLAGEGYASRAVDIPACAVDAPHIRSRQYWVALDLADTADAAEGRGQLQRSREGRGAVDERASGQSAGPHGGSVTLGNALGSRLEGQRRDGDSPTGRTIEDRSVAAPDGGELANPMRARRDAPAYTGIRGGEEGAGAWDGGAKRLHGALRRNGSFWSGHEWLTCHDGKARRTQPGIPLLVDGLPGRVGLWRVAGNAISPVLAAEVLGALMDTEIAS